MLLIPAIDLKEGHCVRLRQGRMEDNTVFSEDPIAVAKQWVDAGAKRLHIVDLDGAFAGKPVNAGVYMKYVAPSLSSTFRSVAVFVTKKRSRHI